MKFKKPGSKGQKNNFVLTENRSDNKESSKPDRTESRRPPRKDSNRSSPLAPHTYIVEGKSSVLEYVRFRPESVLEIFSTPQASADLMKDLKLLKYTDRISDAEVLKDSFNISSPVAAKITLKALELQAFENRISSRTRDLVLILDHLEDPRNLGAIVRSAGFFGVKEIVVPDRRQVFITQSAVSTAQGGFAVVDLVVVPNIVRFTEKLKKESGYWVIGADMEGEHFTTLSNEYEKVLLVLGSEGGGMSRMMREACDRVAMIPGKPGALESLNVSVAAGILLSAFSGSTTPS